MQIELKSLNATLSLSGLINMYGDIKRNTSRLVELNQKRILRGASLVM